MPRYYFDSRTGEEYEPEFDDDRDPGPDDEDDEDSGHTFKRGCPKCGHAISKCGCELDGEPIDGVGFADPGGNSALRAATCFNPRDRPCPSCHRPNMLTRIDVRRGYQCDHCAEATENGMDIDWVCGGAKGGCIICQENEDESESSSS